MLEGEVMNINKDIEILKNLQEELKEDMAFFDYKEVSEAIENVLSELETYKKIAEKLALGCKQLFKECPIYCEEVCEERKENKKTCVECLIDLARKEVEEELCI